MCGILGIIDFSKKHTYARDFGDIGLKTMQNRGPDSVGTWVDKSVYLGHRRLAIIDTNSTGNQPMVSTCGRYTIVFNGEIYNYKELKENIEQSYTFQTHSDTEVILAYFIKYGPSALEYLRGMFAFAIWDKDKDELFVARDRLGVKPLYYSTTKNCFVFASRPQALRALMPKDIPKIDRQGLRYYLEAGYIPAPHSIYEGISKLEPGHYLVINKDGTKKRCYWSMNAIKVDSSLENANENVLLNELDTLINDSVKLRMVSDVPVGAFLSGGIDSSLVTACMAKYKKDPIRTFTIGFQDKTYDESDFASTISEYLGTSHACEQLAACDLLGLMPAFIKHYDEPFFDYSAFPVMAVSRLSRQSVTVSLSGDGGDEAFGGYHYYSIMNRLERVHQLPKVIRKLVGYSMQLAPAQKIKWLGKIIAADGPASAYAFMRGVIKDASNLMQPSLRNSTLPLTHIFKLRTALMPSNLSYAEIGMRLDLAYTLPDDYLQKIDVGSMAFSLEVREPLLDHKIIEWAAKLPLNWKIRNGNNKYLLRKLTYRYLPQKMLDHKKMGFGLPMEDWLRGDLRTWGESLLKNDAAFNALELDAKVVRAMWDSHQSNKLQAHTALWNVLILLQFYNNHFDLPL